MGVASISKAVVPRLDQLVYVNGARNDNLWCSAINLGRFSSAQFVYPQALFDTSRSALQDARVEVYYLNAYTQAQSYTPDFVGYLDTDNSGVSPYDDGVQAIPAASITSYLDKTWVGQSENKSVVAYRTTNSVTGLATRWTPLSVLRDIFGKMPSFYRARVGLGVTTALNRPTATAEPELVFRMTTVAQALDQILALFGDVTWRERYVPGGVYIDFYQINGAGQPVTSVKVADFEDVVTSGANVASISRTTTSRNTYNRAKVFGAPRRFMVSVKSKLPTNNPAVGESQASKALVRDWTSSYEVAVLANPKCAKSGSLGYGLAVAEAAVSGDTTLYCVSGVTIPASAVLRIDGTSEQVLVTAYSALSPARASGANATVTVTRAQNSTSAAAIPAGTAATWLMPGVEHVFRRYRLPKCFNGLTKTKANILKRSTGEEYPVQVWKYPTLLGAITNGVQTGTLSTTPARLQAKLDLEKGVFTLTEPAVNKTQVEAGATGPVTTYGEAVVGITFTYESEQQIYHDTGVDLGAGVYHEFRTDGITQQVERLDLGWSQLTNAGHTLTDEDGASVTFSCIYQNEDTGAFATVSTATSVQDDTATLRSLAQEVLREKSGRQHNYQVTIPYFTRGYYPGVQVYLCGVADFVPGNYTVTAASIETPQDGDQYTTLVVDNAKPPAQTSFKRMRPQVGRQAPQQAQADNKSAPDPAPQGPSLEQKIAMVKNDQMAEMGLGDPEHLAAQAHEADRLRGIAWRPISLSEKIDSVKQQQAADRAAKRGAAAARRGYSDRVKPRR